MIKCLNVIIFTAECGQHLVPDVFLEHDEIRAIDGARMRKLFGCERNTLGIARSFHLTRRVLSLQMKIDK